MASSTPHTIVLRGNPPREEAVTGEASVTPGHFCELNSSLALVTHVTAGEPGPMLFAVEDPYNGVAGTPAINVAYANGETARYIKAQPGDRLYAWLTASGSVNAGDLLTSTGDGAFGPYTAGSGTVAQAQALESVNGSTLAQRIKIMVL